ncbi:thioesterase family protein [Rhizobium sp. RU36D]|uniref:acyl-CoA thioesterase n=1 Tax=Rhizobium sp. RU36D TaxID=1907415 RepID=UPI0009D91452|nr:thioesterase family protein [Rhizobium sp. RU36D]SMC72669.1 (3S)-malyl-CoA thioesterase [Rhizobium sp. RU36D]
MTRPKPNAREDYRVFRTMTTRWSDNDIYGHMNNVVHYLLFDTAIDRLLVDKGILSRAVRDTIFVVAETGCAYFAEMAYPDEVTAGVRVADLGSSSVRYEIGLFRNDENTASAQGHFVHVHVDAVSRRPMPLKPEHREVLEALRVHSV